MTCWAMTGEGQKALHDSTFLKIHIVRKLGATPVESRENALLNERLGEAMGPPKAPRRNCKNSRVWEAYYLAMATWYKEAADVLAQDNGKAAKMAEREADRFREGAHLIVTKTHPNIVAGKWK